MNHIIEPLAERVCRIIAAHYSVAHDVLTPDTSLVGDLNGDDLDRVELACALEEEFGITLSDEDIERQATVSDVIATVERMGRTAA